MVLGCLDLFDLIIEQIKTESPCTYLKHIMDSQDDLTRSIVADGVGPDIVEGRDKVQRLHFIQTVDIAAYNGTAPRLAYGFAEPDEVTTGEDEDEMQP